MHNKSALPKVVTILTDGTRVWRYKEVRELLAEQLRERLKATELKEKTNEIN